MPSLLVIGGGLFGAQAAAWARHHGVEATVFEARRPGAASSAAAGLFTERWAGRRLSAHYHAALPLLDRLYGLRSVTLTHDDGRREPYLYVPPADILELAPVRAQVTAVGDGWLEADGHRHEGWIYVAAGVWCAELCPELVVHGRAGAAYVFPGEQDGRMRELGPGRQALAFVREAGTTYFSDGTAEREYTAEHDRQTLAHAAALGLCTQPLARHWGLRPYAPGGPVFRRLGQRLWLATGGRKMGTILGAAFARRLIEEELR